jgi:hypothetical protein
MDVLHENLVLCPLPKDFSLSNLLILPLIFSVLGNSSREDENEQESSSSSYSEGESG